MLIESEKALKNMVDNIEKYRKKKIKFYIYQIYESKRSNEKI